MQPVSPQLLELGVFSKPQFDPEGLILATRDGLPVGFVHGGFAPNESGLAIDTSLGTTHMLMLRGNILEDASAESAEGGALADDLLAASEQYLHGRGTKVLYGGGIRPLNAFYQGLYGGSEIPGVLHTDRVMTATCARNQYREIDRIVILQCDLARFRAPFSRRARHIKRTAHWVESIDPPAANWWDACLWSGLQRDHFELIDKALGKIIASVSFWDVQPLSSSWGLITAGLLDLFVDYEWRRQGCASHLLGEAFRLLGRRGVSTVEAQTMASNEAALAFYRKLGFTEVGHGLVFRKEGQAIQDVRSGPGRREPVVCPGGD
jgi:ribosomal protein S18 acetylase RimI-like enzyme